MRIARSAGSRRRGGRSGSPPAMAAPTPARTAHTRANASTIGSVAPWSASVDRPKAPSPAARQPPHRTRRAATPYARLNAASETKPKSVPSAARAANSGPCSRARMSDAGPEVIGSPASHPPTAGPQRRPAIVASRMSGGRQEELEQRRRRHGPLRSHSRAFLPTTSLDTRGGRSHTPPAPGRIARVLTRCPRSALLPRESPSPAPGLQGFSSSWSLRPWPWRGWPRSGSRGSLAAGRSSTTPRSCTTSRGGSWTGPRPIATSST